MVGMNKKRFYYGIFDDGTEYIEDDWKNKHYFNLDDVEELLNEQQVTIKNLQEGMDYWKQKYEEGTETFIFPSNCDGCDFLGTDEICKFILNCYDSKEELIDGEVLQNCPLKPLINKNKQLRGMNKQLREINKEIGDDLYNCRVNKNIISKVLKLWQDTLAEYDIYTIKDFRESFELDARINKEKDEKIKERRADEK